MDPILLTFIDRLNEASAALYKSEDACLLLEASEKAVFSEAYIVTEGKNVADRTANAYRSDAWLAHIKAQAHARSALNRAKRDYEIALKSYDAAHVSFKHEREGIRRTG